MTSIDEALTIIAVQAKIIDRLTKDNVKTMLSLPGGSRIPVDHPPTNEKIVSPVAEVNPTQFETETRRDLGT